MILIADSGSTKTHWRLLSHSSQRDFFTPGINPYQGDKAGIADSIKAELAHISKDDISQLFFYGAGCASQANQNFIKDILQEFFPVAEIEVSSDLSGAARGVCGNDKGMVAILGTGANLCYYDGINIHQHTHSLGFILGDEGSGSFIGKIFIQDFLYKEVPDILYQDFIKRYNLSKDEILNAVYKQPYPNRFLAGFVSFLSSYMDLPYVQTLFVKSFTLFFEKHVVKYPDYTSNTLHCVGSVAFHFQDYLHQVATSYNVRIGHIITQPIEGLTLYHQVPDKSKL